jgi:hypothetical protein
MQVPATTLIVTAVVDIIVVTTIVNAKVTPQKEKPVRLTGLS